MSLRGSADLLRNHPFCGDLPITKIHPHGIRSGEWFLDKRERAEESVNVKSHGRSDRHCIAGMIVGGRGEKEHHFLRRFPGFARCSRASKAWKPSIKIKLSVASFKCSVRTSQKTPMDVALQAREQ
jgi:hypothetical protein